MENKVFVLPQDGDGKKITDERNASYQVSEIQALDKTDRLGSIEEKIDLLLSVHGIGDRG